MSRKHPIVAITGSSGAGTSTVRTTMEHIFRRQGFNAAYVEGDCFHRYDRQKMRTLMAEAEAEGRPFSHFGPDANELQALEQLFATYAEHGTGRIRHYVHNENEACQHGRPAGTFTPWRDLPPGTDLLCYEGLHGGINLPDTHIAPHVDLLLGVTPIVNLEWIQKIHRDTAERGYDSATVTRTILRRMHDYVHYITPQFSNTHINFQRVPTVDTSNPFIARDIPDLDESFIVIRVRNPRRTPVDFPYLLSMISGSFMSRRNTIVVPGGKMALVLELTLQPLIESLVHRGTFG